MREHAEGVDVRSQEHVPSRLQSVVFEELGHAFFGVAELGLRHPQVGVVEDSSLVHVHEVEPVVVPHVVHHDPGGAVGSLVGDDDVQVLRSEHVAHAHEVVHLGLVQRSDVLEPEEGRHILRRASYDAHGGLLDAVWTDLGSQQPGGEVDVSCTVVGAHVGLPALPLVGHLPVELPPVVRLVFKEDVLEQVGVVPEHDPFELSDQAVLEVPVHHGASFMISIAAGSLLE